MSLPATLLPPLLGLLMVGLVLVQFFQWRSRRSDGAEHWADVAQELGLHLDTAGLLSSLRMAGTVAGVAVDVQTQSQEDNRAVHTVVRATPSLPLPDGLEVVGGQEGAGLVGRLLGGQDLPLVDPHHDAALRVQGRDARAVQGLLNHPAARPALALLLEHSDRLVVERGTCTWRLPGYGQNGLADAIETAVEAAQALDRAALAPWEEAAERLGLRLQRDDATEGVTDRLASLRGTLDGLRVRVDSHDSPPSTRFCVRLQSRFPQGVRLRGGKGRVTFSDPILDGRLILEPADLSGLEVSPAAVAWLKERLQDPSHDLRGCLMDVLQGLEGSAVEDGEVTVVQPGLAGADLEDVLQRLVALGVALSDQSA